ncbi:hypothetical protein D9613_004778 [Agrocybe pediades]|uniref:Uncharacterized protein n=1 Tax=Agrocybe pediades TaxID=84607 RepID=A0A8H4VRC8_9AGAR|nr:hypothetical protein D9613_004778 [Agrocybe pediades]
MSQNTRIPRLLRCLLGFLLQRMKKLCLRSIASVLKAIAALLSKLGIGYKATADAYQKPAPKADDPDTATLRAESDTNSRATSPQPIDGVQIQMNSSRLFLANRLSRRDLVPVMPMSSRRYTDKPRMYGIHPIRAYVYAKLSPAYVSRKDQIKQVTLPALERSYNKPTPPANWTRYVHPEGARYFMRAGGTIWMSQQKVWTESDIFRHNILTQLEAHLTIIEDFISEVGLVIRPQWNLVINYYDDGLSSPYTGYYLVDHEMHKVFFLDEYEAEDLDAWCQVPGAQSECHIGHEIEAQYWYRTSASLCGFVTNLRAGTLFYFTHMHSTWKTGMSKGLEALYYILSELLNDFTENIDVHDAGTASLLGRLMFVINRERFLNFHGEAHSRLEGTFSVYGTPIYARKWLVKTVSPLLFYAPDFHLRTLQNMSVDGVTRRFMFQDFTQRMNGEWEQIILFGTVVLNANVAFLAIQSVDNNNSGDPHRLPAQVLSYLSIVASVGSILLGLLLGREHKIKASDSDYEIQYMVLRRHRVSGLGMEVLAILFTLPYALLMWGMLAFLAAFASLCFKTSSLSTRITVGSSFLVVACLIAFCIRTNWDERVPPQPYPLPPDDSQSMIQSIGDSFRLPILTSRQTRSSQNMAVNAQSNV